jgi:hypothetical protein
MNTQWVVSVEFDAADERLHRLRAGVSTAGCSWGVAHARRGNAGKLHRQLGCSFMNTNEWDVHETAWRGASAPPDVRLHRLSGGVSTIAVD